MIASGGSYYKIANGSIDAAGLLSEYQQVEYIEPNPNTRAQYIDTGINPQIYPRVVAKMAITNSSDRDYWGNNLIAGSSYLANFSYDSLNYYRYGNTNGANTGFTINKNEIHEWDVSKEVYIDGVLKYTSPNTYTYNSEQSNIYIFASYRAVNNISSNLKSSYKLYNFKLYDGTTLVRNFIPCYRKSDNEIGMYDTVNGVFYTNQGTGTFLKGPNVYNRYTIKEFDRPYISGHVTDESSTFTFKINGNTYINVPVDSNGNWKWYQDRVITSLNRMICFTSTTYTDNIDYLEINANLDSCTNFGVAIALSTFLEKVVIKSKTAKLTDISYFAQDCVNLKQFYAPNIDLGTGSNIGYMFLRCAKLEVVDLRSSKLVTVGASTVFSGCNKLNTLLVDSIKANTKFESSNELPKQFIINIINVAQANVTYTLHYSVYNKCASGGEWYTDVQAAIDAKALEGYTVTLISA